MTISRALLICAACLAFLAGAPSTIAQPTDEGYTRQIRAFTTDPQFLTELVDHLPASDAVATPEKVLGYIAGSPDHLTYAADVHRYMRAVAEASPRVRVSTLGHTEEGREMILVMISDEENLARLDELKDVTKMLADPRTLSDDEAGKLIQEGLPFYWATGAMHSPETGSPEMLMELAYRLAVEETPFIQTIRKNLVVMLTPVLEVDGRERMVDIHRYKKANPDKTPPPLVYWGKYIVHDNNRDGFTLSLALSRNINKGFLEWHPQVLHDLHESIPYLYISTGMGPYNAWYDPILTTEWQKLAFNEVEQMTKQGVAGVWTHGFFDGWGVNYMFTAAHGHNAIGRFYETFGNMFPETVERTLPERSTERKWYRPNPPFEKVKWSIRNNVNLQQSALLYAFDYVARNKEEFLHNFYLKSKRSVAKATAEGPAAWVIPSSDARPLACAEAVNLLRQHGVEVHRLTSAVEKPEKIPAGSYVVRMDQPYSRMADMLFDRQYYNASDTRPYDATGWSIGPLRNIQTMRLTKPEILDAPMEMIEETVKVAGEVVPAANPAAYLIAHNTENALATFRYRLAKVKMFAAEESFEPGDAVYPAGTFIIKTEDNPDNLADQLRTAAKALGLRIIAVEEVPDVPMHPLAAPRIALVHNWTNTQAEGWMRIELDKLQIPYHYISGQTIRSTPRLREKYDVILLGPTSRAAQEIVNGLPMRGEPIPWKGSELTPNIGTSPDQSEDIRGGMGLEGLIHIREFIKEGGLFVAFGSNAAVPIDFGFIRGVTVEETKQLKARGSVLQSVIADKGSPITYGYGDELSIFFDQSPVFQVSKTDGFARRMPMKPPERASGRGTKDDPDIPQGRPYREPPEKPDVKPGEELPIEPYLMQRYAAFLPAPEEQPRTVLKFAEAKKLLVSGMLAGGNELANRPVVVDAPVGNGHVVLFAANPMWRSQTRGSFFLLFNAIMNYDNLNAGREDEKPQVEE